MNAKQAMNAYTQTKTQSGVDGATPVQLINMLLEGALERIAKARGHMERGDLAEQGELIGKVIDIVASLDAYLDVEKGGEVAQNLESLYDYMVRKLFDANKNSSLEELSEVESLLLEIREGWVGIAREVQ